MSQPTQTGTAALIYRFRWLLSLLILTLALSPFVLGVQRIGEFSAKVGSMADTSNGSGQVKPLAFDPSMDIWFGEGDAAVETYRDIEKTFVAEDYVMVAFEADQDEWGVFSKDSLATISRLTERFLTVPGVRHVRSLTYNPWIRWGSIPGDEEPGLIISDLVVGDPTDLSEDDVVRRMIATLGAQRTADKVGEERVRRVLGDDASFEDHQGEPLLLGTILNENATATVIQVQVRRPYVEEEEVAAIFDDPDSRRVAPSLSSIEQQRAALRGIEHFLRLEYGTALPTPELQTLESWVASVEDPEKRARLTTELRNPNKNFMKDGTGQLRRKYFEYDRTTEGYVDGSEPNQLVSAPADFQPQPLAPFEFHLGGIPCFERNFEVVGLADAKYVPLMFLVIAVVLAFVFRNAAGVVLPLVVVFVSVMAMVGSAFALGELLNNLTMMAPNMLTAVGIADAIHLLAAWFILRNQFDTKQEVIVEVIRSNALPVFLTSVTTSIGFLSLSLSSIVPVQQLGYMAALGTVFAWLLSMTLVPAILSVFPHRRSETKESWVARLFSTERSERIVDSILARRKAITGITIVVFVLALIGALRVQIDSDFRGMFPDDNRTMSDFTWIEDRIGGVGDLELVFANPQPVEGLNEAEEARRSELEVRRQGASESIPEFSPLTPAEASELDSLQARYEAWNEARIGVSMRFLADLDRFEKRLRSEMQDPESSLAVLTDFVSPLDTLRKIHQVQNQNAFAYYRVPSEDDVPAEARKAKLVYDEWTEEWSFTPAQEGSNLVAQYYLQYENGARPGEALSTQLSADRKRFRMQSRVLQASSIEHLAAFDRIREIVREEFPGLAGTVSQAGEPPVAELTLSGKSLLFARTSFLFATGFMKSIMFAVLVITVLIGLIFRSPRFAIISLIPNVLPIMLPLSVFGYLGVALDGPSILVSSVALGVCVDDTIHFFSKFSKGREAGASARDALVQAMRKAGAAVTVTTIVLIIGFSTLLLSDFEPNFQMGALAAFMIGLAWIADLVVTTAVLSFESGAEPAPTLALDAQAQPSAS